MAERSLLQVRSKLIVCSDVGNWDEVGWGTGREVGGKGKSFESLREGGGGVWGGTLFQKMTGVCGPEI